VLWLVPEPDPGAFLFGPSRLAGAAESPTTPAGDDPFGPRATSRAALPEPGPHARRLVIATLEVMAGRRGLQQLMPHLTEATYERLSARLARAVGHRPPGGNGPRARIRVGRAVVCEPTDGVAEVSVVARLGDRVLAVAVRLEGVDGRWRCTVLDIL
jgi:hypothetical protein